MGIEICAGRADLIDALKPLAHSTSWLAVAAERAVSRAMGGSCSMPLAAHAVQQGEFLHLRAAWGDPEGNATLVTAQMTEQVADLAAAERVGLAVAERLRAGGAH